MKAEAELAEEQESTQTESLSVDVIVDSLRQWVEEEREDEEALWMDEEMYERCTAMLESVALINFSQDPASPSCSAIVRLKGIKNTVDFHLDYSEHETAPIEGVEMEPGIVKEYACCIKGQLAVEASLSETASRGHTEGSLLLKVRGDLNLGEATTANMADLILAIPFPPRKDFPSGQCRAIVIEEAIGDICSEMVDSDDACH